MRMKGIETERVTSFELQDHHWENEYYVHQEVPNLYSY
jgi:hypothetical protein